jgi:hypothetical protein
MVKAQEWLDRKCISAEAKTAVKRIGREQTLKGIGSDLFILFMKGRPLSTILTNMISNCLIEENVSLEGPLSIKGFVNLEFLFIGNHKITELDVSDCLQLRELRCSSNQLTNLDVSNCLQLRELHCSNNQLTNLDVSNNRQLEQVSCSGNKLTNLDFTGLDKIEKIFCCETKLANLEFLNTINPANLVTLRINYNKFPARDLSCFTPFYNLERLYIGGNPFYGSLKPLRNLTSLKGIGIADTDIDSGLEYLPEDFFKVNATASGFGLRGGYFKRNLYCTGKLAVQLKNYKIENDPLRNYNWEAWKRDNQELINKAKSGTKQEDLIEIIKWEIIAREIKELYEQVQCDIYRKTQLNR